MQTADDKRPDWITENLSCVLKWIGGVAAVIAGAVIVAFIWRFHDQSVSTAVSDWGTVGDYFGGMLNPVFSFLALVGLLVTLYVQSRELKLSREMAELSKQELELTRGELKNSAVALAAQNESINLQRFEQTFFAWLESYQALMRDLQYGAQGDVGRAAMQKARNDNLSGWFVLRRAYADQLLPFNTTDSDWLKRVAALEPQYQPAFRVAFMSQRDELFRKRGLYGELRAAFTTLEALLGWVDAQPTFSQGRKQFYFRVVTSHLSWIEGYFVFIACLGMEWPELRQLALKYEMLSSFAWAEDPAVRIVWPLLTSLYIPSPHEDDLAGT